MEHFHRAAISVTILITLVCGALVVASPPAHAQVGGTSTFEWLAASSGFGIAGATDVTVDDDGNVYTVGLLVDTETFGSITVGDGSDYGMYLAKYDSSGNELWVAFGSATDLVYLHGVRTDAAGNVYVSFAFEDTVSFGTGTLTAAGGGDIALAKFDPNGSLQWAQAMSGPADNIETNLEVDSSGNAYVVGSFENAITAGSTTVSAVSGRDVYLAKFDTAGNLDWIEVNGRPGDEYAREIALDAAGSVYTAGTATDGIDTLNGHTEIFVSKWDTSGNLAWTTTNTGVGSARASALVTHGSHIYLAGGFTDTILVGGSSISSVGLRDTFIAKYDGAGLVDWASSLGTADYDGSPDVAVDADGTIYSSASFTEPIVLGSDTLNLGAGKSGYIARHDASGNVVAAVRIPAAGVQGASLAIDGNGDIYMTTLLTGSHDSNGTTIPVQGGADTFLVKYSSIGGQVGGCAGQAVTINMQTGDAGTGTAGNDVILGTSGPDVINGLGGDDIICGEGGDDIIDGGDGNDVITGGYGTDFILGGTGDDTMSGDAGNDRIRGQKGADIIHGGAGNDFLYGGVDADEINGGDGRDTIGGFGGADMINGGAGNDNIFGGFGADVIDGGDGNDKILGLVGNDIIKGGTGDDTLAGDNGQDTLSGGPGNDVLKGGNSLDNLSGNAGDDSVNGGKSDDVLSGGSGVDTCSGNLGNDIADVTCETTFGVP